MTRPRNRRHQNPRPRRGGGDEDEVVGGEDGKRMPLSGIVYNESRSTVSVVGILDCDTISRPSAPDSDDIKQVNFPRLSNHQRSSFERISYYAESLAGSHTLW